MSTPEDVIVNVTSQKLTREAIVKTLVQALEPLDCVHALYEGGAVAFNRVDEWSDIDLYLIVNEGKTDEAFAVVEKALQLLSPIKHTYQPQQLPWRGVSQTFYTLENASEYLLVDFAVLTLNSPEKFLEPEIHGNVVFHFNKSSEVRIPHTNENALAEKLKERIKRLRARYEMFSIFVQKELNRHNYLEALDLYHAFILASLVETLRIKYGPFHHNFETRYIYHELPPEVTKRLEHLYSIRNEEDLQNKYHEASVWLKDILSELG